MQVTLNITGSVEQINAVMAKLQGAPLMISTDDPDADAATDEAPKKKRGRKPKLEVAESEPDVETGDLDSFEKDAADLVASDENLASFDDLGVDEESEPAPAKTKKAKAEPKISVEDVIKVLQQDRKKAIKLLTDKYKVSRVQDLPEEKFAEIIKLMGAK